MPRPRADGAGATDTTGSASLFRGAGERAGALRRRCRSRVRACAKTRITCARRCGRGTFVAVSDPLDGRPLVHRLHALAGAGLLGPEALERALGLVGGRPTAEGWYRFARVQLILLGTALVVVGAIFFVAANWDILTPHVRIGLAAAAMTAATAAGGWIGLDRLSGRAAALAGGLLFGPLMALVGQVYQTGADAYELFLAWSLVMVGYALATRFAGAWICALLLGALTVILWIDQALGSDPFNAPGLWVSLLLTAALTGLALVRRLRRPGEIDALGLVALALAWLWGFLHGTVAIVASGWPPGQGLALICSIGQASAMTALGARTGDHNLERIGAAGLFGLLSVTEGKILFDTLELEEAGLFLMGLFLIAQGYAGARWLSRRAEGAR